jgi:hypothetical protein
MIDVVMKRDAQGRERPQEKEFDERKRVVRVLPKNDEMRKYLKHGGTRVGFLAEGSVEWPNDQFTRRRLKDGDVILEGGADDGEAEPKAEPEPEAAGQGDEAKVVEASGAKSPARSKKEAPPPETSAAVDPNKTTAPKT